MMIPLFSVLLLNSLEDTKAYLLLIHSLHFIVQICEPLLIIDVVIVQRYVHLNVGNSKDENQSIHSMTKTPLSFGRQVQSYHDRFSVRECFWTVVFQDYKTAADGTYAFAFGFLGLC